MTDSHAVPGRVVVGVDGSQRSREALRWAHDYAVLRSWQLDAIHVWTYPSTYSVAGEFFVPQPEIGDDARALLESVVVEELGAQALPLVHLDAPFGHAGLVLAEAAIGADLVVVGDSGAGVLSRMVLGSTSAYLVHHAPCPVVVVRPHRGSDAAAALEQPAAHAAV